MATFPPIEFHLQGAKGQSGPMVCITPSQYFFVSDNGIHCIGINSDAQNVIGANLMENFNVVFDQNKLQMGTYFILFSTFFNFFRLFRL